MSIITLQIALADRHNHIGDHMRGQTLIFFYFLNNLRNLRYFKPFYLLNELLEFCILLRIHSNKYIICESSSLNNNILIIWRPNSILWKSGNNWCSNQIFLNSQFLPITSIILFMRSYDHVYPQRMKYITSLDKGEEGVRILAWPPAWCPQSHSHFHWHSGKFNTLFFNAVIQNLSVFIGGNLFNFGFLKQ